MRTARTILAAALAGAVGYATPALAQERWDMPVRSNERNFMTQNIDQFASDLEQATGEAYDIVLHPEASLVQQPDVKRAVQTGQVPLGEYLMSMHSNENPIFGIDSIPFLATDYEANRKLAEAARPAIEEALKSQRLRLLFIAPWPPQGIYTKKEISALSDLSGVKFRAYNPNTARMAELMGATPVTVQQAEVPQAFSTGVIEAMITSPATGVDTQAWDFVQNYYDAKAFIPWNIVVMNERVFQGLDAEKQQAVLDAAKTAEERAWQRAPEVTGELTRTLEEHGMTIHEPGAELQAELEKVGETMLKEWLSSAGEPGSAAIERFRANR